MPMTRQNAPTSNRHTTRLAISWLVVIAPLTYGVFMAIKSILPLFGG